MRILDTLRVTQISLLFVCAFQRISFGEAFRPLPVPKSSPLISDWRYELQVAPVLPWSRNNYKRTRLFDSPPTSSAVEDIRQGDEKFDIRTTLALIGGQSVLILLAVAIASALKIPNWGLGPSSGLSPSAIGTGLLLSAPMGIFAASLDLVEDRFPALQDVTKATQRSVLVLLGGRFKPLVGLFVATVLGVAAGLGEEMLFRGILQNELGSRVGAPLAIFLSSAIFGALHAVTPLYALLAAIGGVYFGVVYVACNFNLVIPIVAHAFYDIVALFHAHKTVADLTPKQQQAIEDWDGPGS